MLKHTLVAKAFEGGETLNDVAVPAAQADLIPTLLLVEDEIWMRLDVAGRLRGAGFKVVEAHNGEEALALLRSSVRIDLVLTDLQMPRMDGAALVAFIRAQFPHIPIFMTSGQLPSQAVYKLLDGFFSKPLDIANFIGYLEASSRPKSQT